MQFVLAIYAEPGYEDAATDEEQAAVVADYLALLEDPRCVWGGRLEPVTAARFLRVVGGQNLVTDGPFADTKEVLGGLCLIQADTLGGALDFAARIPTARLGGTVEVRALAAR